MAAITHLEPSDHITVDSAAVAALFRAEGAAVAEDVLMRHVIVITDYIATLDARWQTDGTLRESKEVHALGRRAAEIGLISLAQTLVAVAHAVESKNRIALPALWERAKRIGDRSLLMLWDLPQLRV